ncbi:histone-lysine N-methyltransferase SETDB2 isoform X2 [Genypterus blacodes]|uniref:histone-lysine N-methyltransferase SETDB2 isoform X2 n=1 Tax=Genypterus blacodes TaxID=154954 RepID=UPI003F76EB5A
MAAFVSERAKVFWAEVDVDRVLDQVLLYLEHLRTVLKKHIATDKEYVQGLNLLSSLDDAALSPGSQTQRGPAVLQVVIGSEVQSPLALPNPSNGPVTPPATKDELLPSPTKRQYESHTCSVACLPALPSMPQCTPLFWAQNPLKVPLLCGFLRVTATSPPRAGDCEAVQSASQEEEDVIYQAPCGLSLCNYDEVMRFLLATDSFDILQVDFFSFNPAVQLDPPPPGGPRRPELDLSRGMEPTPVELCPRDEGSRPADFRYRKDRWPHGCFLNPGPQLFSTCCDCTDGCSDAERCACVNLTRGGRHYAHDRLSEPVPSGVYECGPWCGCDPAHCQNRLVQRGIRVRLQVFQTDDRGWGVRCRDDVDGGTFVCIYAGVLLRRAKRQVEAPPPKLTRADLPSDDEVEVVTEWLTSPGQEVRSSRGESPPTLSPPTLSPLPLYVPVIQRPSECSEQTQTQTRPWSPAELSTQKEMAVALATVSPGTNGSKMEQEPRKSSKRTAADSAEDVYLLDAGREGNVGRFINHNCQPNLFVQNVFTDCHDSRFPLIAFFTNRVVKAGAELTWDYSSHTGSTLQQKQEVPCLCGSDSCRSHFIMENLCEE